MTRGKYGSRAANREQQMTDAVAPYQRKVAALTSEVRELKDKLRQQQQLHAAETRKLRAERDEGIGPALIVAQREAAKYREQATVWRQRHQALQKDWSHFMDAVIDHLCEVHKLSGVAAIEAVMWMVDPEKGFRRLVADGIETRLPSAIVDRVRQKHTKPGYRSSEEDIFRAVLGDSRAATVERRGPLIPRGTEVVDTYVGMRLGTSDDEA